MREKKYGIICTTSCVYARNHHSYYYDSIIIIVVWRQQAFTRIIEHSARINIFRDTRWEQSEISDGCLISCESWKRSRGKTRLADTCHEHRWSSPSLTPHFQPISRISSTFRIVLAIARFHAPCGRDWNWRSSRRWNKTKIRTIAFSCLSCNCSRIYRNKIPQNSPFTRDAN